MHPDFLIIPKIVHRNKRLRPTDWLIYAAIYWYEHMKDGKCFASNESLSDVAQVTERSVMSSLERLEKERYIKRLYTDEKKTKRSEIKCLVSYLRQASEETIESQQSVLPGMPKPRKETPGEFAARFFKGDENAFQAIIGEVLERTQGRGREVIEREMPKFVAYWTESNKSGTKQLWQMKPTFEIKLRLYNWLSRAGKLETIKRSGAGVEL